MPDYCVNTQETDGAHEVHEMSCNYLPAPQNQKKLGWFSDCHGAVAEAKKTYSNADGCWHCSRPCHTR